MSSNPLVSIGLSLYNGDRFLEGVLDSFLNQTFRNFEFIISDDCSTDRSELICRRYAAQDARIRYYRNKRNMGAGWNANQVYELATGKYFKQATQDAMIQPDFLRLCVDALEEDHSLVLAHGMTRVIDEGGRFVENYVDRLRTSSPDPVLRARDLLLKGHGSCPISGLIRLDVLHQLRPKGIYAHSDRVLLLQLGLRGRFYEVPEHLFIITAHADKAPWTTPAPEGWDPAKAPKLVFPEWNAAKEFTRSVARSPLSRGQRLRGYGVIARWALKYRRRFATDIMVAAYQLLRNLQNRNGADRPSSATDAAKILIPLDLNPREGGSL
jgi:glycosyltransferase involved in cell wall biosynthesis